jgi:predicted secreted Zn-dependent protease
MKKLYLIPLLLVLSLSAYVQYKGIDILKDPLITNLFIRIAPNSSSGLAAAIGLETNKYVNQDITYHESYRYYQISGNNESVLRTEMNNKRYICYGGVPYDGCADWYIRWSVPIDSGGNRCQKPIYVNVEMKYTLPQWNTPNDSPIELKNKWEKFIKSLKTHEDGHKENAVNGGKELLKSLNDLSDNYNCSELGKIADIRGNGILEEIRKNDLQYDDTTNHGFSQGARFP